MSAYFQPFLDRVRKQSDSPDPVSQGVPYFRRVSHSHGLSPTNESGRRHSAPAFAFSAKDSNQQQQHQHLPPKQAITLWGRMIGYMGSNEKRPTPLPPLQETHRWAESESESQSIDATHLALVTRKYGEISAVASRTSTSSRSSIVVIAHKTQYCPPIDRLYALKLSRPAPNQSSSDHHRARLEAQAALASAFRHPHIVNTLELLPLDKLGNILCLCMEYCAGGDLRTLLQVATTTRNPRVFSEANADCLFKQLLRGLVYLHNRVGVAHCDLAPENLLLTEKGRLKIGGFERAVVFRKTAAAHAVNVHGVVSLSTGRCGSILAYVSPEQYTGQEFDPRAADIWAAALIYVAMRTGGVKKLWSEATEKDRRFAAYVEDRKMESDNAILEEICNDRSQDVLYGMLSIDPAERPAAGEILASAWMQDVHCCIADASEGR
ncbi:kinase-like domain-containing protein [Aspergillus pseudoustus]|uniref:Kinase-like domain-containing protein n=1 Tax=Aspergillus pseudoustus TaxID=1810923 RepID=A0ABR4IZG6_9EURO